MIGPRVSIVMPCYNVAKYIEYALMSISLQSYKNFELVIVNDGSTDNTRALSSKIRGDFKVIFVDLKKNRGLPAALNEGMKRSSGDLIARFDPDDFMLDWRLRDQVSFLCEHPDIELLGGGARLFGSIGGEYHQRTDHSEITNEFLVNNPFIHPTIMFRRELYDSGLVKYREDLTNDEDYELWSRVLPKAKVANLHYPLIKYRIHNTNAQRNPGKKQAKKIALKQFLGGYGYSDEVLVDALAEFQCSQFLSFEGFNAAKAYAQLSRKKSLPKLGWLHDEIETAKTYATFMTRR